MPSDNFPHNGLVIAADDENTMGELAHAILDDIMYNVIHDIVLKTHRDEKMARSTTAAIVVEQKAAQSDPQNHDESSVSEVLNQHVETEAAVYTNGEVYIKGNALKTTPEIRCPKCGLPRLLHPTDGNGARKPDSSVEYCKKVPFIDKGEPYDIYGQRFQEEGPGRGNKRKKEDPLKLQSAKAGTPTGSQDSNASPSLGEEPPEPIRYPHAKCHNCSSFLPIRRMNGHMAKCLGGGGRNSSKTALMKIQNGNGTHPQNGVTPPGSRNSTPGPSLSNSNNKNRLSPGKRDREGDDGDSDSSPQKKPKKLLKKTAASKLKAPKMIKSASNLSFEERAPGSESEGSIGGEDDRDGEYGTVNVEPKKKIKSKIDVVPKRLKEKKKWLHGKGGNKPILPPVDLGPGSKIAAGGKTKNGTGVNGKSIMRAESESSQTLSSPN